METVKRLTRAEREARWAIIGDFWEKEYEKFVPGKSKSIGEWMDKRDLHRRKLKIIEQGVINGTVDIDKLLVDHDLAKYL